MFQLLMSLMNCMYPAPSKYSTRLSLIHQSLESHREFIAFMQYVLAPEQYFKLENVILEA